MKLVFIISIIGLLMLISGCENLSAIKETEVAWQVVHAVDLGQTITIARNPERYHELDCLARPLIGSRPSERSVVGYFISTAAVHWLIAAGLDQLSAAHPRFKPFALMWEGEQVVDASASVYHNNQIGIGYWEGTSQYNSPPKQPAPYVGPVSEY